jgi:NADH:ubiquinone oxidoreductase subunit 5 (subunit L)/multisubunit Na+/H+ antiporter MnhA subunit
LAFAKCTIDSVFSFWLGILTAFFTAIYSFRLIYLVFLNKMNSYKQVINDSHELPIIMAIPLWVLSFGSIFTGYISRDIFGGFGSDFFIESIFVLPENLILVDAEFIPIWIKLMP